jgi:hypothetical protein
MRLNFFFQIFGATATYIVILIQFDSDPNGDYIPKANESFLGNFSSVRFNAT